MRRELGIIELVVGLTAACSAPTVRNCELDLATPDNGHDLSYTAVMPSDCPVPLGMIGEEKFIGATLVDGGASDYGLTIVNVKNAAGQEVGNDKQTFLITGSGARRAQPRATFPAATAYSGAISQGVNLPSSANDRGLFQAWLWNGQIGSQGRLTVGYRGTTVRSVISGPDVPPANTNGSWSGSAVGGTGPYSYAWYRNGELVSTSANYSSSVGTEEFGLRLVVTDQTTASRWTDYWVDPDGVRATIDGPQFIYAEDGYGTWTANIRGGYEPYTINWYFENEQGTRTGVGSGPSINTAPSQFGNYTLIIDVTDSHGTPTTAILPVFYTEYHR